MPPFDNNLLVPSIIFNEIISCPYSILMHWVSTVSQTPETLVNKTNTVCALRNLHPLLLVQSLITVNTTSEPLTLLSPFLSVITGPVMPMEKKNHQMALFNTNSLPLPSLPSQHLFPLIYHRRTGQLHTDRDLPRTMPGTQKAPSICWITYVIFISATDLLSSCATFASHPHCPFNRSLELL